jgi:hypothetical protein
MTENKFPDPARAARSNEARKRDSAPTTLGVSGITLLGFTRMMEELGYERCNHDSDSVHFQKRNNAPKKSRKLPSHLTMSKPSFEVVNVPFGRVYDRSQIIDFLMRVLGAGESAAEITILAHLNNTSH